ncbi:MAG: phospholipase D-like domain-containing protein [Candidatus Methanomethylophilaceae archaeon]|nr:phospholipase D-like domain-containing protein [Candidatus Methanomethylophilaceae archaeon]
MSSYYDKILISILIVTLFLSLPILVNDTSDASDTDWLRFYEVNPFGNCEGFSLYNYNNSRVDLKDLTITDGEGTLTFGSTLYVEPYSRITIVKAISSDDWFSNRDKCYVVGTNDIIKTGTLTLADVGDDLYLYNGEILIDAICYGNKTSDIGWSGESIPLSAKKYFLRTNISDTDTSSDWILTKAGFTNLNKGSYSVFNSTITPFTFPESNGEPIYKAFENAENEILISIYQLTSPNLLALLCNLEKKTGTEHVDVTITLEGDVLGYDMSTELSLMRSLVDVGGEVRLINDPLSGNYERYSFFHNKYAIIDGKTVIITSENWTKNNMSYATSNRGWGAVIESAEMAEYMRSVFDNDRNKEYGDVWDLTEYYPDLKPYEGDLIYEAPSYTYKTTEYTANVTPIVSPDNSYDALQHFIYDAEQRIYSEQLDLGSSYSNITEDSPVYWMASAAKKGIDTRFILDASISDDDHTEIVNLINTTTEVKAITISGGNGFTTTHNKGVIVDDMVWLGSVNWTETSFMSNRETAVIIDSEEIAEYFEEYFLDDWGINKHTVETEGLKITAGCEKITTNSIVTFSAVGPEGYAYSWDIYSDGNTRISTIPMIVCTDLTAGFHKLTVRLEGTQISEEYTYEVILSKNNNTDPDLPVDLNTLLLSVGLITAGGITVALKGRYNNKKR